MKKLFLLSIVALFSSFLVSAQNDIFSKPAKEQLVVDQAGVFTEQEITQLKEKLHQFSKETSTQVLIYTTPDLQGYDVGDFAQRLGQSWGIGSKEFDNGIVIVFKPKNSEPGRITIQTGYGIEPLIPDAVANQIIDNEMIPEFKNGNVFNGFNKAIDVCISLTKGEFTAANYESKIKKSENIGGAVFILIIFLITVFSLIGKSRTGRHYNAGTKSNLPLWAALFMLGSGSHRGSGFGDFSSGSGSFGGFGGGSFGGGGASGSW